MFPVASGQLNATTQYRKISFILFYIESFFSNLYFQILELEMGYMIFSKILVSMGPRYRKEIVMKQITTFLLSCTI